jgi:ABC-type glycerol-3-phosphate transport system substrate-binding protein
VQVTHNKGDFDAQQFLTALASNNPPDLVYMDRKLIGTYAARAPSSPSPTASRRRASTPRSTGLPPSSP